MEFGTEPKKLVRKDSIDTSIEAAYVVDTTFLEELVYRAIYSFGRSGCISDNILGMYNEYPYSSITARYRALLDKGYIVDTGERRKGKSGKNQRVLCASKFMEDK